jgi:hypothetical protein
MGSGYASQAVRVDRLSNHARGDQEADDDAVMREGGASISLRSAGVSSTRLHR